MRIAVDAADLCDQRVDGTRIYIKNVLDFLGVFEKKDDFLIYAKGEFNRELTFKNYPNYQIKTSWAFRFWTQTRFPQELKRDRPAVLWMPLQTVPFFTNPKIKVVVTIHDLAFKIFPQHFPKKDFLLLSLFTKRALKRANRIIAVSQNTKKDIEKFYPDCAGKITVVPHGYDRQLFCVDRAENKEALKNARAKYQLPSSYLLYAGALQPRKNLEMLISAFEVLKENPDFTDLKLVLAGSRAWLSQQIYERAEKSSQSANIIFSGPYQTKDLPSLLAGAEAFIFPSLYEGFGLPMLEAMATGTPVVAANNSSLPEVGGAAPIYFKTESKTDLAEKLQRVLTDQHLRKEMIQKGLARVRDFSWEKCAEQTMAVLKG
jgi:glycosyltransferase involved in cell wall biosynthesis